MKDYILALYTFYHNKKIRTTCNITISRMAKVMHIVRML